MIPRTMNAHFNFAIGVLLEYHEASTLGHFPCIDFRSRPVGIRSGEKWSKYLDALMVVDGIGRRNKWTRWHQDRSGQHAFLVVDIPDGEVAQ